MLSSHHDVDIVASHFANSITDEFIGTCMRRTKKMMTLRIRRLNSSLFRQMESIFVRSQIGESDCGTRQWGALVTLQLTSATAGLERCACGKSASLQSKTFWYRSTILTTTKACSGSGKLTLAVWCSRQKFDWRGGRMC
jgi:hypothetical protein